MSHLQQTISRLTANADAIRALVQSISDEQAEWKPDSNTWSMREVMSHVYNEERVDFRMHLREMFDDPPQPWGALDTGWQPIENCRKALDLFLNEREESIAWLNSLPETDWDQTIEANFGPQIEKVTLRAGDLLVSWVDHDYLHIRQMNELLHAWNEKQASPYSIRYAGGW